MNDPAAVYAKLRAEAAKLLNLDVAKLSALESMQCDLVGVLMLEIDNQQAAQLAGRAIDISRVADAVKILRSLLPAAATTEARPNYDHEFDGAHEAFARAIESGAYAIAAREEHLLKREVAERDAEIARLRAELEVKASVIAALGGSASTPAEGPVALPPQTSPQPPLPPASSGPPAAYLARHDEPWRPYVDGSGIRTPLPIPGSPRSPRTW
jgi:hypothetical protein